MVRQVVVEVEVEEKESWSLLLLQPFDYDPIKL